MTALSELTPNNLWRHFDKILSVPHGSGDERALADATAQWAAEKGFEVRRDPAGNVVIFKEASPGVLAPCVVLQAHLDMVCEKNASTAHDFTRDPIVPVIAGNIMKAAGTTLGADNGIGVAAALAILEEPGLSHPPIEVLLTVEEETGLTGAAALTPVLVTGKTLLNLDSEEEGIFYIGCAGGQDTHTILPLRREPPREGDCGRILVEVRVTGLAGGHSGCNINEHRGNALKILSATLSDLMEEFEFSLVTLKGGNKDNAIPREASAAVAIPKDRADTFSRAVSERGVRISTELPPCDSGFAMVAAKMDDSKKIAPDAMANDSGTRVEAGAGKGPLTPFTADSTSNLLSLLAAFPDGVANMSNDIPGLVETSCNLAIVDATGSQASITCSMRSSIPAGIENLSSEIRALVRLAGGKLEMEAGYPGWKPNPSSRLLAKAEKVYGDMFGNPPEVKAIHAGLECGIIGECLGGMDMLSFGPTIKNPHCPDELVEIDSVKKFYDFLKTLLTRLGEGN